MDGCASGGPPLAAVHPCGSRCDCVVVCVTTPSEIVSSWVVSWLTMRVWLASERQCGGEDTHQGSGGSLARPCRAHASASGIWMASPAARPSIPVGALFSSHERGVSCISSIHPTSLANRRLYHGAITDCIMADDVCGAGGVPPDLLLPGCGPKLRGRRPSCGTGIRRIQSAHRTR